MEAETQRLNEVLKESSEKHAEELKKQEERVSISKLLHVAYHIWPWISLNSCLILHRAVALYYTDPQSGQAHQQLEKEVPEGVGAEQRKTAADWNTRAISGWPPDHGRLPGPAQKGTALSDGQPTKQKPFFSCGLRKKTAHNAQLEMLLLCFIARHLYSIHCTHISHIWSYCILYLKITYSLPCWLTKSQPHPAFSPSHCFWLCFVC